MRTVGALSLAKFWEFIEQSLKLFNVVFKKEKLREI